MRRKEREIFNAKEINQIFLNSKVLHLGFNDEGHIYVVPVNFGYTESEGKYTLYFHGAKAGRKYELIQKRPAIGFECMDEGEILIADDACNCSTYYSSIIGEGVVEEITDFSEKKNAMDKIMEKNTKKTGWDYSEEILNKTGLFKIIITDFSCKRHKK